MVGKKKGAGKGGREELGRGGRGGSRGGSREVRPLVATLEVRVRDSSAFVPLGGLEVVRGRFPRGWARCGGWGGGAEEG